MSVSKLSTYDYFGENQTELQRYKIQYFGIKQNEKIKRGELGRWIVLFKKTLDEEILLHPEFKDFKELWLTRLTFFEGVFSRFFGF